MKIDEPFNPLIKSHVMQENIIFELAEKKHTEAIINLTAERNPLNERADIQKKTEREIALNKSDPDYWLFVATLENEVVGFCRFYHSRGLPKEKIKFNSPEGWYAMGTLVSTVHRRKGIAKFLFQERLKILKKFNTKILYSIVDANNQTSIKMHHEFGFIEQARANGFLHLDFPDSEGILFKFSIG